MSMSGKRVLVLLPAVVLLAALLSPAFVHHALAATPGQLTSRSLTLQSTGVDANADGIPDYGGSEPSGVVNHFFDFKIATNASVGSILFQYCTTATGNTTFTGDCTVPTGLDTTTVTQGTTNNAAQFETLNNTTNGKPYLTRAAPATINATTELTYTLDNVTNPSTVGTFFVRISTYASQDTSGIPIDEGTVAASTTNAINLTGTMPESLIFCTGATIGVDANSIPDCTTATPGTISFNQLFSPTDTAFATSQMAASTNAGSGYVITVNGPTLTSGTNTIAAMGTATTSQHGKAQFGMDLMLNDGTAYAGAPTISGVAGQADSANVTPAANGTNFRGQPKSSSGYDVAGTFKYVDGDAVAASDNGGAGPTDSQIFTSSYIVNVSGSQPAGSYKTTLTYICTPTF